MAFGIILFTFVHAKWPKFVPNFIKTLTKLGSQKLESNIAMEQHALKNLNNCLNAKMYSYLETSGGQSSNLYLDVVHIFNASIN